MIVPETTRLTIPFLIDLLPHQFQIKDREKIIDLLVDVVDAATESSIFGPNEQEAQLVFEVIERGLPIYMHLMDVENRLVQENEEVRYQVARLLGYFPSYTEAIQPILAKAFFQEESERVQLAMLASWERLT